MQVYIMIRFLNVKIVLGGCPVGLEAFTRPVSVFFDRLTLVAVDCVFVLLVRWRTGFSGSLPSSISVSSQINESCSSNGSSTIELSPNRLVDYEFGCFSRGSKELRMAIGIARGSYLLTSSGSAFQLIIALELDFRNREVPVRP
jgi:hypothetical protein